MKQANGLEFLRDQLKDEIVDMENPNCSNCNECCSMGTMLLPSEFKVLKKYLRGKEGRVIYLKARKTFFDYYNKGTIYWMCPFSNKNKRCAIYNIRPQVCREFHCKKELAIGYDKSKYESSEHLTIFHLFDFKK